MDCWPRDRHSLFRLRTCSQRSIGQNEPHDANLIQQLLFQALKGDSKVDHSYLWRLQKSHGQTSCSLWHSKHPNGMQRDRFLQLPFLYLKLAPSTSMCMTFWEHALWALSMSHVRSHSQQRSDIKSTPKVGSNPSLDTNFREVMWIWHLCRHVKEEVLVVVHLPPLCVGEAKTFQLWSLGMYSTC